MKKIILLTMALSVLLTATAFAEETDYSLIKDVKTGCSFPVYPAVGKNPCGENPNHSCIRRYTQSSENRLELLFGLPSSLTTMFPEIDPTSWSNISNSWYFDLIPSLSKEDANVLLFLISGHDRPKEWLMQKGSRKREGLIVDSPIEFMNSYYTTGRLEILPATKQFYAAYFNGNADEIRALIKTERPIWEEFKKQINAVCKTQ